MSTEEERAALLALMARSRGTSFLRSCVACKREIGRRAQHCPHCGERQPLDGRRLVWGGIALFAVSLIGTIVISIQLADDQDELTSARADLARAIGHYPGEMSSAFSQDSRSAHDLAVLRRKLDLAARTQFVRQCEEAKKTGETLRVGVCACMVLGACFFFIGHESWSGFLSRSKRKDR